MENAMQLQPAKNVGLLTPRQISYNKSLSIPEDMPQYNNKPRSPFIIANTEDVTVSHLRNDCVVPVFSKDNEVTISHTSFIDTVVDAANKFFSREKICDPEIRVSHIIKGRTPDAIYKHVNQLLDSDKTIYYERMMFAIEIPTIHEDIMGNRLNLTIGGVRTYNHENLYSRKSVEKFKVFIGFKNLVCCNMCVSTDGFKREIKAMTPDDLFKAVMALFAAYNMRAHLQIMTTFQDSFLTEHQFAQFIGKSRLYQNLPSEKKKVLPEMLITDTQISLVAKAYYQDGNFALAEHGEEISMWNVYNLLTGANKSSYIDNFLDRSLNASDLSAGICQALNKQGNYGWFIE